MKNRIMAAVLALMGATAAVPGVMSTVNSVRHLPKLSLIGGVSLPYLVSYYDLRWEILLIALGAVLWLTAGVLLLSPRKRRVTVPRAQEASTYRATEWELPSAPADGVPLSVAPETVQVYHAKVMGSVFANPSGRGRQQVIGTLAVGDVVVCRALPDSELIGLFTVKGEQMGYLDARLVREIRTVHPYHRIGAQIERIRGGEGLPYTCHVRVTVFGAQA